MIKSFKCKKTEAFFVSRQTRAFASIAKPALRKLAYLHAAMTLDDLRVPPNNRLEALKGKRKGQFSIRINDQYRICFKWDNGNAEAVEIVDYH